MVLKLPKIIGHRCSRNEGVYENTFDALEAVMNEIDGVEIDVVLSKDKKLFFIHDTVFMGDRVDYELNIRLSKDSLRAVNNRRVDELTKNEISSLVLIDGQRVFDLESFIGLISNAPSNFIVNFELKSMETFLPLVEEMYKLTEKTSLTMDQFIFSSFNHEELSIGRQHYPDLNIGILFEPSNTQLTPMYPWLLSSSSYGNYVPYNKGYLYKEDIQELNPKYICLNEFDLRVDTIDELDKAFPDVPVLVWWYYFEPPPAKNNRLFNTLKDLRKRNKLDRLKGIITDYPLAMKQEIKKLESA